MPTVVTTALSKSQQHYSPALLPAHSRPEQLVEPISSYAQNRPLDLSPETHHCDDFAFFRVCFFAC